MDASPLPPLDVLQKLFRYDPQNGELLCNVWKTPSPGSNDINRDRARCEAWNADVYGKPVGCAGKHGRRRVCVAKRLYYVHRVVWKLVHGVEPDGIVDHIDGDPSNNKIENLRLVSASVNSRNKVSSIRSKSGYRGVYHRDGRYMAAAKIDGAFIILGWFDNPEQAYAERLKFDNENAFTIRHIQQS